MAERTHGKGRRHCTSHALSLDVSGRSSWRNTSRLVRIYDDHFEFSHLTSKTIMTRATTLLLLLAVIVTLVSAGAFPLSPLLMPPKLVLIHHQGPRRSANALASRIAPSYLSAQRMETRLQIASEAFPMTSYQPNEPPQAIAPNARNRSAWDRASTYARMPRRKMW